VLYHTIIQTLKTVETETMKWWKSKCSIREL